MTCDQAREQFSGWVDEALDPSAREQLAAHLAGCPECPRDLDRFTRTVALLAGVERPRAPVGFVDRVMAAIGREPWYRRALRWLPGSRPAQLPVSIAATAVIAMLTVYLYHQIPELQQAAGPPIERIEPLTPVPAEPAAPARPAEFGPTPPPPAAFGRPAAGPATPPASPAPATGPGSSGRSASKAVTPARDVQAPPAPQPGSESAASKAERSVGEGATALGRPAAPAPGGLEPPAERRDSAERSPAPALRATRETAPDPAQRQSGAPPAVAPAPVPPPADLRKEREAMRSSPDASGRLLRPPDVIGRLAVADAAAALSAIDRLVADLGATSLGRRQDVGATVVDLMVPRSAYARLEPGLRAIGVWSRDVASGPIPEVVHVTVRVATDDR